MFLVGRTQGRSGLHTRQYFEFKEEAAYYIEGGLWDYLVHR